MNGFMYGITLGTFVGLLVIAIGAYVVIGLYQKHQQNKLDKARADARGARDQFIYEEWMLEHKPDDWKTKLILKQRSR